MNKIIIKEIKKEKERKKQQRTKRLQAGCGATTARIIEAIDAVGDLQSIKPYISVTDPALLDDFDEEIEEEETGEELSKAAPFDTRTQQLEARSFSGSHESISEDSSLLSEHRDLMSIDCHNKLPASPKKHRKEHQKLSIIEEPKE
mmetsp:Transcript_47464/g.62791  ORF Transcript_47464/g.62791 Transcript_47464/m.62791 type:complete len:146 (-) Transcript_47464:1-438(-)